MNKKKCIKCGQKKTLDNFRVRNDNNRPRGECKVCERNRNLPALPETVRDPTNPRDAKELAMKRMLSAAKSRAKEKGLMFNIHYEDIQIPNLCPILKIPLIPSTEGMTDNSPSLDRLIPYLGYTKGNVKVISMKANRIKQDATSAELRAVANFVEQIEQENT
jgi:hypothetical protein